MYDHAKYGRKSKGGGATGEADRRGGDRHLVIASAEIVELGSGARFSTRTTDLGPGGCFVDTLTPFPVGSKVRVTVFRADTKFESEGKVVYSQPGLGMGVAFSQLDAKQSVALEKWLAELTASRMSIPESKKPGAKSHEFAPAADRAALIRLVQLMISKGILTEAEGSAVFQDPII